MGSSPPDRRNGPAGKRRAPSPDEAPTLAQAGRGEDLEAGAITVPSRRGPASEPADPGGDSIGAYRVVGKLGEGGMGVVYSAHDLNLDRRVAIKLVRADARGHEANGDAQGRLLREAQAMAKVVHPNVVAVHDVGTHNHQVFIAMEYLDGGTLDEWCIGRPWEEIVAKYVEAGRGLVAAHQAGLVHRDFKPANVLVGKGDRVVVCDFGLVSTSAEIAPLPSSISKDPEQWRTTPLATSLTRDGALLGTPNYMAPEQHQGGEVDARCDQFAFCVALWEALYRRRPFAAESYAELAARVCAGEVREPHSSRGVPARLQRVLRRGLRPDPQLRYPTMARLLDELDRDLAQGWRGRLVVGVVAAVLVALAAVAAFAWRDQAASTPLCRGADRAVGGVWNPEVDAKIRAAFVASGHPLARESYARVVTAIDDYLALWTNMREDACLATNVREEQSEAVLDLRIHCLNRRLSALDQLIGVFAEEASRKVVDSAAVAVARLQPLAGCADIEALTSAIPPPHAPEVRQRVDELNRGLDRAIARHRAGNNPEAMALAAKLTAEARLVDYLPTRAWVLYWAGVFNSRGTESELGEALLREALAVAVRVGDDPLVASIWIELMWNLGYVKGRYADAIELSTAVEAAVARAGDKAGHAAYLAHAVGSIEMARGELAAASAALERGLARAADLGGDIVYGLLLETAGMVANRAGDGDKAQRYLGLALACWEDKVGVEHIQASNTLNALGTLASTRGEHERALDYYQRALRSKVNSLGEEHPNVAIVLNNVANELSHRGRHAEAREHYERALAIGQRTLRPDHPNLALALHNLGTTCAEDGDHAAAIDYYEQAMAITRSGRGAEHVMMGAHYVGVGDSLREMQAPRKALPYYEKALAIWRKKLPSDHVYFSFALAGLGACYLDLAEPKRALQPLTRALALRQANVDAAMKGQALFLLARAYWDSRSDRSGARELAEKAAVEYRRNDNAGDELGEVEAWLATHEQ